MDERLKQKLELLGEPTLPDSLSAEELFRRMDLGELTLPEDRLPQPEPANPEKVIPWVKVVRRVLPIAACLALVVFLSQGGLWRMGSSGGANLSGAAAPQQAADQSAPAVGDGAPIESYSSDADEDAPDPAPWAIAIEDDAEAEEAPKDAAAPELARQGGTKNGLQDFAEDSDSAADAFAPGDGPDTGGPPTGGGTVSAAPSPDFGGGNNDDPDNSNPDTGGGGDDKGHSLAAQLWELLEGIISDLFGKENDLAGLTPEVRGYSTGPSVAKGGPLEIEATVFCLDDQREIVSLVTLQCTAIWSEEQQKYTMRLNDWGIGPAPSIDDAGDAFENPDTSEMPPWDPDSDPTYGTNPDVGAENEEEDQETVGETDEGEAEEENKDALGEEPPLPPLPPEEEGPDGE